MRYGSSFLVAIFVAQAIIGISNVVVGWKADAADSRSWRHSIRSATPAYPHRPLSVGMTVTICMNMCWDLEIRREC